MSTESETTLNPSTIIVTKGQDANAHIIMMNPSHIQRVRTDGKKLALYFDDHYEHVFEGSEEFLNKIQEVYDTSKKFNPKEPLTKFPMRVSAELKSSATPEFQGLSRVCKLSFKEIVRVEVQPDNTIDIHAIQYTEKSPHHVAFKLCHNLRNTIYNWSRLWN